MDRALLRSAPVKLDVTVVDPTVVSKVEEPLVFVETMAETSVVAGTEVRPGTPLMPEMVVSPVTTVETEPLVTVEVQALVVTAVGATEPLVLAVADPVWLFETEPCDKSLEQHFRLNHQSEIEDLRYRKQPTKCWTNHQHWRKGCCPS